MSRSPSATPSTAQAPPRTLRGLMKDKKQIEQIRKEEGEVKNAKEGESYLVKRGLTITGEPFTLESLVTTTFYVSQMQSIPIQTKNAIRAIAFMLESLDLDDKAARITEAVGNKMDARLQQAQQELDEAKTNYVEMMGLRDKCTRLIKQAAATQEELTEKLTALPTTVTDIITESMAAIPDTMVEDISKAIGNNLSAPSYRDILIRGGASSVAENPALVKVKAQAAIRYRQILFNVKENGELAQGGNQLIVEKANEALEALSPPQAIRNAFKTATKLQNGKGVMLEVKSDEAMKWINEGNRRKELAIAIEDGASVKERTFSLIVPFVPLALRPEREVDLREIEEQNDLETGVISRARWVKPEHRRAPNQTVAHLILIMSSPSAANKSIRDGLSICQKKVYPKKLKREPIRCLKCQGYGHIATRCLLTIDICGTCSGNHRTESCTAYKTSYCVSCQTTDHPSWHRECPEFKRKCRELDERSPENTMPYFLTEEAWTNAMEPVPAPLPPLFPPRPPTVAPPPSSVLRQNREPMHNFANPSQRGGLRQTTLPFRGSFIQRGGARGRGHPRNATPGPSRTDPRPSQNQGSSLSQDKVSTRSIDEERAKVRRKLKEGCYNWEDDVPGSPSELEYVSN